MSIINLMTLPTELHEFIIDHLDFRSRARLKYTNHYFDNLVKETDIHKAEKSDYANLHGLWACHECHYLLPSWLFSDKSKKGPRSKTGRKANLRFCVPCGVMYSLYGPGDRIIIGGTFHLICMGCLKFKKCRETFSGLCDECYEKRRLIVEMLHNETSNRIRQARLEAEALKELIRRKKAECYC